MITFTFIGEHHKFGFHNRLVFKALIILKNPGLVMQDKKWLDHTHQLIETLSLVPIEEAAIRLMSPFGINSKLSQKKLTGISCQSVSIFLIVRRTPPGSCTVEVYSAEQ